MKSEPETYGIAHLKRDGKTPWSGVRNFQARNYMRDEMRAGDPVLFYHSNCKEPGAYGIAEVASAPYPDETQFDPKSDYFERRATREKPVWHLVDVAYVRTLETPVLLRALREDPKTRAMETLRPGSRLSITPLTQAEFDRAVELGGRV